MKWFIRSEYRNCGKCAACRENRQMKPHGPYIEIRRRVEHGNGKYQHVYLGSVVLPNDAADTINLAFTGDIVPSKEQVILTLYGPLAYLDRDDPSSSHD